MTTRAQVVQEARSWIGTRWHHGAALKAVGTDCIGLIGGVAMVLRMQGAAAWKDDVAFKGYGRRPDPVQLLGGCEKYLDPATGPRQLADILVMRFEEDPQHFGIVSALDPAYMIHAYAGARKVAENRIDELWESRIIGSFRYRGLTG